MGEQRRCFELTRRAFVRDLSAAGIATLVATGTANSQGELLQFPSPLLRKATTTLLNFISSQLSQLIGLWSRMSSGHQNSQPGGKLRSGTASTNSSMTAEAPSTTSTRSVTETGGHAGPPWTGRLDLRDDPRRFSDFLASHPDPELDKQLDGYIGRIAAAAAVNPNG